MMRSMHRQTMADFSRGLGSSMNSARGIPITERTPRVTDKTELTGIFEFRLEFAGTISIPGLPAQETGANPTPSALDPGEGPDLFGALEKQLGLKLVKTKNVPIEILVVDHVDKLPTEN